MTGRSCLRAWFIVVLVGCAPTLPASYQASGAAAERAYAAGRYREAADHWLEAAKAAKRPRDAEEARFRAAASFARAGRSDDAQALYRKIAAQNPPGERAARAEYERIRLVRQGGRPDLAQRDLRRFVRTFPSSGLVRQAVDECLRWFSEHSTPKATLQWLDGEIAAAGHDEAGEVLAYRRARLFDDTNETRRARDAYLAVATRYPYPRGAYWDDALWYASLADERLGDFPAAISHLNRMLAEKEPAYLQGSYARPRYDQAQYRIAELYRDKLGKLAEARRAFDRVFTDHPTSRLRDDALWNEALIARRQNDSDGACRVLYRLAEALPESRYVPCVPLACPGSTQPTGKCRDYVRRELEAASNER